MFFHFNKKQFWIALITILFLGIRAIDVSSSPPEGKIATIVRIQEKYVVAKVNQQKVFLYNLQDVRLDDMIQFTGEYKKIQQNSSFYGFNYQKWANRQAVYYQAYVTDFELVKQGKTIRNSIFERIESITVQRAREFIMQSFYGIDNEQNTHEFAFFFISSGMHIGAFLLLFRKLSGYAIDEECVELLLWIIEVSLGIIFRFPFIFFRVIVAHFTRYFIKERKQRLGVFSCLCLLYDPYCIFRLSFSLVFMIQLLACFNQSKGLLLKNFYSFVFLQLIYFKQFLWIQYFIFKPMRFVFGILYAIAWLTLIFPQGAIILQEILFVVDWVFLQASILAKLKVVGCPPYWVSMAVLWLLLMGEQRWEKLNLMLLAILLIALPSLQLYHPFGEVTFINVGQGDSILIRLPYGKFNILIDTGMKKQYSNLKSFLLAKGIQRIDVLIISHPDEDHDGAKADLQRDFDVKLVIDQKGQNFHVKNLNFEFLLENNHYEEKNDNSLISFLRFNKLNLLFLADISAQVEKDLLQAYPSLSVDFIKLAHHGSKTSSGISLLSSLKPKLVLISSGLNNRYNHPSLEVTQRLKQYGIASLNTQSSGDISIYFTTIFNFLLTSERQFGIINRVIK